MKKIFLMCFLVVALFLTACEPKVFGVPQSTWNTLTPTQKQQVIDSYNQQKVINAVGNAVNSAGKILQNSQQ